MNEDRKTLNISRYSSRRLYNTSTSEYVTVDDLAKLIRSGYDINVVDKKSGENITCQILLQIIADQEAADGSILPANILTDIIRNHSSENRSILPKFLSETFERLSDHRSKISGSLRDQMANPLDPRKALNSLDAWRDAQNDIVNSVISAWLPPRSDKPARPANAGKEAPEKAANEAGAGTGELEQLKKQIEEMQHKLQNLSEKHSGT